MLSEKSSPSRKGTLTHLSSMVSKKPLLVVKEENIDLVEEDSIYKTFDQGRMS